MPDSPSAALPASTPLARLRTEEAVQEELRAIVQFAFLRRPLAELLVACAEASLDVIVLKGAALAETVYPRPGLRWFGDLDILVRAEEAPRAYALLSALGYAAEADAWADLISGRSCEANFFQDTERGPVVVELHTDLLNNALLRQQVHLDLAGLWRRSRPARLAGRDARVLGPEDQLLHLCLHLAGHYFTAPNSQRDMVKVCEVQVIDWPLLVALCRNSGAATLGYGGLFAAGLDGASVPPSVREALAPRRNRRLLEKIVTARVLAGDDSRTEALRLPLIWLILDGPGSRRRAFAHLVFPSRAWLHAHYFYDLFDPPDPSLLRRLLIHGLRRLPLGGVLYARHLWFLVGFPVRLCLRLFAGAVRKPDRN